MAVRADCRHYIMQTNDRGEKIERCRMGANEPFPFACPEGCVFFEARKVSSAGWHIGQRPGEGAAPEEGRS